MTDPTNDQTTDQNNTDIGDVGDKGQDTMLNTDPVDKPPGTEGDPKPPDEGEEKPKEGEEEKPKEEGEEEKGAPEEYEAFKLPEGQEVLDEGIMTEFKEVAKADNLSQAQAQKYIDLSNQIGDKINERITEAWNNETAKWKSELESDPVIGGHNLSETKERVARVMRTYAAPGLKELGAQLGFGNHKAMIQTLVNFDKATGEGKLVEGLKSKITNVPKTIGESMYPDKT